MRNLFRSLTFGSAIALGSMAFAQPLPPYPVIVMGQVIGCDPAGGNFVNIVSVQGTQPALDIDVPVDANCGFSIELDMESFQGWFELSTLCGNSIETATVSYQLDPMFPDSNYVFVVLNCSGGAPDCEGVVGGPAQPGTACDDGDPDTFNDMWTAGCVCIGMDSVAYDCLQIPNGPNMPGTPCNEPVTNVLGTWSANCECLPNVGLPCEAGFWVMQAYTNGDSLNNPNGGGAVPIPFELWVWNLSTGGTGNYQFVWDFGDGTSSTEAFPTHVYPASGPYTLCLTVTDGAGCDDTYCEDIEVDQDGILGMGTGFDVRSVLTIRVIQELPTGIDEGAALEATKLWPNPVAEQFDLTLNSSRSGNITLTIVDLNGREVRTTNVSVLAGNNQLPMDVSGLEAGMYVLRLTNGNNSAAMRFVKQ